MTNGYEAAMLRNLSKAYESLIRHRFSVATTHLGIFSVHTVKFDVPLSIRSFEIADK